MITMDDLKSNRDTQITVACIVFFLIAFPGYFAMKGGNASGSGATGGVGDYNINGNLSYVGIADGIEYIADGETLMIDDLHTDAVDGAEDMNIVGVRVMMSYGEDEETQGPTCGPGPTSGQDAADTISGTAMHAGFNGTAEGQNNGGGGTHDVTVEWFNSSMVGATVSGLSESEIISQIDSMGAGLGSYSAEISVDAEAGNAPALCSRSDGGEEVTYSVELIVFDYTIAPAFDESEL
tara:strand:- start:818 stop:1528 length:711 start_codon:yes stop_codon:yes gene_type:complete